MTASDVYAMKRGWMDNDFFKDEPYSDRDAWCWMIGEARFKDGIVKGVFVKRGQLYASIRFMADKFMWSKDRVTRFLKRVEKECWIRTDIRTGQYLITVCNYEDYQFNPQEDKDTHKDANKDSNKDSNKDKQEERSITINNGSTVYARENFRKVYDEGSAIFPKLASRRTAAITKWLEAGADPELDILPEIRRAAGRDVRSWGYFDGAIADALNQRIKPMPTGKVQNNTTEKKSYSRKMAEAAARAVHSKQENT